jgi:hypothetical protein
LHQHHRAIHKYPIGSFRGYFDFYPYVKTLLINEINRGRKVFTISIITEGRNLMKKPETLTLVVYIVQKEAGVFGGCPKKTAYRMTHFLLEGPHLLVLLETYG